MTDVVVTVPMDRWDEWITEGDLPGDAWSGMESHFNLAGPRPFVQPGERIYIVSRGKLRGYAPLVRIDQGRIWGPGAHDPIGFALVRHGGAVAVTIPEAIRGFRGWRYRFWDYADERPFPNWRNA